MWVHNRDQTSLLGFSLIEVLVSAALLGGLALVSAQVIQNQHKGIASNRDIQERDDVVATVSRYSTSPNALNNTYKKLVTSSPMNDFVKCIDSSGSTADCDPSSMPSPEGFPLTIYPPTGNKPISGTPSNPVLYKLDGSNCSDTPNDPKCAFQVTSTFIPNCGGVSPCKQAKSIQVKYHLEKRPGFPQREIATAKDFKTETYAGHVDVSAITNVSFTGGNCTGPGEVVTGVGPDGVPTCEDVNKKVGSCLPGSVLSGFNSATGTPICYLFHKTCPLGTVSAGMDAATNDIKCVKHSDICAPNQVLAGIDVNGNGLCVPRVPTTQCPPPQVVRGYLPDGTPNCVNTQNVQGSCAPGWFVQAILPDGALSCAKGGVGIQCEASQVMVGINPSGIAVCAIDKTAQGTCPAGKVVSGFNPDSTPICADPRIRGGNCMGGASQKLVGITRDGEPVCVIDQNQPVRCPSGKVMVGIDQVGQAICENLNGARVEVRSGVYTQTRQDPLRILFDRPFEHCTPTAVVTHRFNPQPRDDWRENSEEQVIGAIDRNGFSVTGNAINHEGKQKVYLSICEY